MKKSLVALATLAATGAMAQVSITGLLDFANANVSGTMPHQNGTTFSSNQGTAATSVIRIEAVENLGNGMKATVHYGLDPRTLANDALGNTPVSASASTFTGTSAAGEAAAGTVATTTTTANTTTGLSRDQVFIGLAGGFGDIKLGSANSVGLTSFLASSVLGTGIGSGFAPGSAGTGTMTFSTIRYNRSVRYDSPNMNGFSVAVLYAPGNDEANTITYAATANPTGLWIPNARATTEIGLAYANGPLSLSVVSIKQDAQTNKTGWYSSASAAVATSNTSVNAKYVLGNTTIVAGMNDGDSLSALATKGSRVGVSHAMGNVVLAAQLSDQETTSGATTTKAKVTGLRADYNFSKTTTAYVGYENWDSGKAAVSTTAGTGERKITSIGLRKSF